MMRPNPTPRKHPYLPIAATPVTVTAGTKFVIVFPGGVEECPAMRLIVTGDVLIQSITHDGWGHLHTGRYGAYGLPAHLAADVFAPFSLRPTDHFAIEVLNHRNVDVEVSAVLVPVLSDEEERTKAMMRAFDNATKAIQHALTEYWSKP